MNISRNSSLSSKTLLLCGAVVWLGTTLHAQTVIRGPYLQSGSAEGITVCWRTDTPTDSRVQFGPNPGDLGDLVTDPALTTEHAVTLTDLESETRYFYAIGTSDQILAGDDENHAVDSSPRR